MKIVMENKTITQQLKPGSNTKPFDRAFPTPRSAVRGPDKNNALKLSCKATEITFRNKNSPNDIQRTLIETMDFLLHNKLNKRAENTSTC